MTTTKNLAMSRSGTSLGPDDRLRKTSQTRNWTQARTSTPSPPVASRHRRRLRQGHGHRGTLVPLDGRVQTALKAIWASSSSSLLSRPT